MTEATPKHDRDQPPEGELLAHAYDGIQEYDNPTPGWWKWIFFGSFVFSVVYFVWYHGGPGVSELQAYEQAKQQHAERYGGGGSVLGEEELVALAGDPKVLRAGQEVYEANCASCHAPGGKGLVGPNLTDAYQIHGDGLADIYRVIVDGVPEKGMMAWGPVLKPDQVTAVAAYVASIRNTNAPEGKPPEGEPIAALVN